MEMTRGWRMLTALTAVGLGLGVTAGAAGANEGGGGQPASQHCADHRTATKVEVPRGWDFGVDGPYVATVSVLDTTTGELIEVTVTIDGTGVVFSSTEHELEDASFCIKGGPANTGPLGGTSGDTGSIPNRGGQAPDISYVVLYSVATVEDDVVVPCGEGLSVSGGFEIFEGTVEMGATSGDFLFAFEAQNQPDWFELYYEGERIFDVVSGTQANNPFYAPLFEAGGRFFGASGTDPSFSNTMLVSFGDATSTSTQVTLRVTGSEPGTVWSAVVNCPTQPG
jgi:hypothetical protein